MNIYPVSKTVLIALVCLFSSSALIALQPGDVLYVHALSGLNLRAAPSADAASLYVIPYADDVLLCAAARGDRTIRDGWYRGEWLHVEHRGMEGYVYSGYVSTLAIPILLTGETSCSDACSLLQQYVDQEYEQALSSDTLITRLTDGSDLEKATTEYADGAQFTYRRSMQSHSAELLLKDTDIMDAYNLVRGLLAECPDLSWRADEAFFILDRSTDTVRDIRGEGISIRKKGKDVRVRLSERYALTCYPVSP